MQCYGRVVRQGVVAGLVCAVAGAGLYWSRCGTACRSKTDRVSRQPLDASCYQQCAASKSWGAVKACCAWTAQAHEQGVGTTSNSSAPQAKVAAKVRLPLIMFLTVMVSWCGGRERWGRGGGTGTLCGARCSFCLQWPVPRASPRLCKHALVAIVPSAASQLRWGAGDRAVSMCACSSSSRVWLR